MTPNLSSLQFERSGSFLGGVGTKDIYTDATGKKWIFKHATPKFYLRGTKPTFEPWRIHAQLIAAFLTGLVKPDACIPVYAAELNGVPGTLQPLLSEAHRFEHPVSWKDISATMRMDIAREHIADWIGSQHDSHAGNWIEVGKRLICTDKEQGYKYFGKDKLGTDYHPNASYGERPPLYNAFWKGWARKEFELPLDEFWESFKPLYAHVDTARQFAKLLDDYAKSCPSEFKRNDAFVADAFTRYMDAKFEFTTFLHSLRGKE